MSPEIGRANTSVTPRTYGVEPRYIQTCQFCGLPNELILEILSHFDDPHRKILLAGSFPLSPANLDPAYVERLTIMRRLTMTCWHLRNLLFPLLWKYVEGCNFHPPGRPPLGWVEASTNGLHSQCSYLLLNPAVCANVQTLSADLDFNPEDLVAMFVECLTHLPNLRTLEIFGTKDTDLVVGDLERNPIQFANIRELAVSNWAAPFIEHCPNVETVTLLEGFSPDAAEILNSHGMELKMLKRVVGIAESFVGSVALGCPHLQEISIRGSIVPHRTPVVNVEVAKHLRSLMHLAIVELNYNASLRSHRVGGGGVRQETRNAYLKEWRGLLVQVLKDSSSTRRKFLRWKFTESRPTRWGGICVVAEENGELEVFPGTPLVV